MMPRTLATQVAASFLALAFASPAVAQSCAPDRVDMRDGGSSASFSVEIADTDETRARGLMFVEEMGRFEGMLFVYDDPIFATFWMENTLIPLDMLFMDETGTVTHVHANAEPLSRDIIPGGPDVLLVLEINGGMADRLGLGVGAQMRHPAVPQDRAAWPCPE